MTSGLEKAKKLTDLIERVKAATGPDREIDARLWCMDNGHDFVVLGTGRETYGKLANSLDDHVVNPHSLVMPGHLVFQKRGEIDPRHENRTQMMGGFTRYTDSVDSSLTLVEGVLPGWTWMLDKIEANSFDFVLWEGSRLHACANGLGKTAPLAILAALLNALQSLDTGGGEA